VGKMEKEKLCHRNFGVGSARCMCKIWDSQYVVTSTEAERDVGCFKVEHIQEGVKRGGVGVILPHSAKLLSSLKIRLGNPKGEPGGQGKVGLNKAKLYTDSALSS